MKSLNLRRAAWCILALGLGLLAPGAQAKPSDWAADIDKLTQNDAAHPPAPHGIVFVGSSSIRFWETLEQDFPGLPVIRRGFGGSELADSVYYLDRLVVPYQPDTVVLYAGENDIAAGKTPEQVAADFEAFCTKIHAALPQARIFYISMKPSPLRWALHYKMQAGNALIATYCADDPRRFFVDVYTPMLGEDGHPQAELFRPDMLHMKHEGYLLWAKVLTPLLKP